MILWDRVETEWIPRGSTVPALDPDVIIYVESEEEQNQTVTITSAEDVVVEDVRDDELDEDLDEDD